ncbi:MAG TPA: VTC domain-containing protein [Kofleriaceae bacterium]|nr:VTC domain-containing protein [Kofleriaceae bacterium]
MARSETWRDQRERRYLVDPERVSEILTMLATRLPVVSYSPGSTRTFMVTTYLDSPERAYLSMVERSAGHLSLKVRVREYMPLTEANGEPERLVVGPTCFLERKERVGEMRVKQRIEVRKADVARVLRGEAALAGDRTVVSALRAELDSRDLEPVLVSRYVRRVFGSDRGLRVTFDEKIGFHAPPEQLYDGVAALTPEVLGEPIGHGPDHILELKEPHSVDTPSWLVDVVEALEPADQFSKFRDGMRCLTDWRATGSDTFRTSS